MMPRLSPWIIQPEAVMQFYNSVSKRRAVVPRHFGDLPAGTLQSILREAGFSKKEVIDFFSR
jgi:hypothetical protein